MHISNKQHQPGESNNQTKEIRPAELSSTQAGKNVLKISSKGEKFDAYFFFSFARQAGKGTVHEHYFLIIFDFL